MVFLVACSSGGSKNNQGGTGGEETGGSGQTGGSGGSTGGSVGTGGATGGSAGGGAGAGGETGGAGGGQSPDSGADTGGAGSPDGGAAGAGGAAGGTTGSCGTMMVDISKVAGKENIIFGPDGTIYTSSRAGNIGRFAPPYTTPEDNWATAPGNMVFGIILDPKKKVLYAGDRTTSKMYAIHTDDPKMIDTITAIQAGVNGLTLSDDGLVYYTDQGGNGVWVVDPAAKTNTKVNMTPVPMANGIGFAPDGRLCASTYTANPQLICMKLGADHKEMMRTSVTIMGGNNGDGLAFDKEGNAYVQAGKLFKVSAAGMVSMASAMGGANAEFGAGPVNCKTIFMAGNPPKQVTIDIEGADVPWHRP
jgi:hypothetical protein